MEETNLRTDAHPAETRKNEEAARRFWNELAERASVEFDLATQELMEAAHTCNWTRYDYLQRVLHNAYAYRGAAVTGELLIASPYFSASDQRELALRHATWMVNSAGAPVELERNRTEVDGPLRIGFLGADFYQQATSYLMVGLIEEHDREAFHYIAYDYGHKDSSYLRQRLIAAFDAFRDVGAMDNASIAALMRDDRLDVLIYLRNPADPRAQIMALRPAPLRLAYLYNPGGFGAPLVDYLVADAEVAPESLEHLYSEKIVRLNQCYQPNDAQREASIPTSRRELGLPEDRVVLANLGSPFKITPAIFDLWCAVLRARPESVLWLLETRASVAENLWREAHLRGVIRSAFISRR
jgi:protein O-GlcNAc transferase